MTRRTRIRRGATLVELLVAAAMSIMIMWLLTWCYQQGLASFSNTKSHADLMDQERMVTSVLNRDLAADHFLTEDGKPNGGRKVHDQRLDLGGYAPPKYGFFYAYSQGPTFNEGTDTDVIQSTISTNHILQFTTILPGGPAEQMFNADVPFASGLLYGRAAEISYYLVPSGLTLGGTQLHHLIRRQRLCALTTDDRPAYDQMLNKPPALQQAQYPDASEVMAVIPAPGVTGAPGVQLSTRTLNELATGPTTYRLQAPSRPVIVYPFRVGEDILISNVISFEVKFTGTGTTGTGVWPRPLIDNTNPANSNPDWPYDNLPGGGVYDTNLSTFAGMPTPLAKVRITGVQIRLRAHDPKSHTTRQTTLIVDL